MKLVPLILSLVVTLTAWAAPNPGSHVVVLFGNEQPEVVARDYGVGRIHTWHRFQAGRWGALSGFSCSPNANQLARMQNDTRVQFIETNVTVYALSQTIPTGVRRIGCTNNALWLADGAAVTGRNVAVIDTGIYLTHPDLNVYTNVTFVTGTTTGNDDNGHGTHCAGIIGAKNDSSGVVGVAPGCRLWAVKVLGSDGSGSLSQIISGVDYVTAHAAEIEVANMSLGGRGPADSLRLAISNSVARGVVYVVAAGNASSDIYGGDDVIGGIDDSFPAAFPEVMAVSALVDTDGLVGGLGTSTSYGADDSIATFSNYSAEVDSSNPVYSPGAAIDVAAPGVNIYSTVPPLPRGWTTCTNCDPSGYRVMSGTSMAAPHAAGAVALYIAANARASTAAGVYAIRQAIVNSAQPQSAWGINAPNPNPLSDFYPEGLLDVAHFSTPVVYPVVSTTMSPLSGGVTGQSYLAKATAIDATDGNISANFYWYSSLSGFLATGSSVTFSLPLGTQTVYATVTNSVGSVGRVFSVWTMRAPDGNTAPTVSITTPTDSSTVASTDAITFAGTATDAVDGNIASRLRWASSIDGLLGTGASFVGYLSAGSHTITASVTNSAGLSGSHSHSITVTGTAPANHPPTITITSPPNGQSYPQGSTVPIYGTAADYEQGDLSSSINWNGPGGLFAIGANASTNGLAIGTNTITASVQDAQGAIATQSRSVIIVATNAPATVLSVTVTTDRISYVNKMKAQVRATVTANGSPVSGASVTFTIRGASGKTQTKTGVLTGSTGVASYVQNIQSGQLGVGDAVISANASKAGTVSGVGSTTISITR